MGDIQLPKGAALTPEIIESLIDSLDSMMSETIWIANDAPERSEPWHAVIGCGIAIENHVHELEEMLDNLKKKEGAA